MASRKCLSPWRAALLAVQGRAAVDDDDTGSIADLTSAVPSTRGEPHVDGVGFAWSERSWLVPAALIIVIAMVVVIVVGEAFVVD